MMAYWISKAAFVALMLLQTEPCRGTTERLDILHYSSYYTSNDDRSWAVRSQNLSSVFGNKQEVYDSHLEECGKIMNVALGCNPAEGMRLKMNNLQVPSVRNYTEMGFAKIQTPEPLFEIIQNFWERNRDGEEVEWPNINPYHNMWDVPTTIIRLDDAKFEGGGHWLHSDIYNAARDVMERWSGQRLSPCSTYGIRLYKNQSILAPHVDRMPLVISAIINVDQDVDEPWPLEVYDHQGVAHNITMEPGEMILYESHSVIHGRPFPLNGRFFANVFVHFQPLGALSGSDSEIENRGQWDLPPYIISGSPWEEVWRQENPRGWELINDPHEAVRQDDKRVLEYIAEHNPDFLSKTDRQGWAPIHIAVQYSRLEILDFLIKNGVDIHANVKMGFDIFKLGELFLQKGNPLLPYLEDLKARTGQQKDAESDL